MNILELMKMIPSKPPKVRDQYWTNNQIIKALHRNGVLAEKARRERRSLTKTERQIISAIRRIADEAGFSRDWMNSEEMSGERNLDEVFEPIRVEAKFAYWTSSYGGMSAFPSYLVIKSNHPDFPVHGNMGAEDLKEAGFKVPKTPTFDQWDRDGRRCYRG